MNDLAYPHFKDIPHRDFDRIPPGPSMHSSQNTISQASLQKKTAVVLGITAFLSALTDGFIEPPDDGGWHYLTAALCTLGVINCSIAYLLTLKDRINQSGILLISTVLVIVSGTFISGTPSSVLVTIIGIFCLLTILPSNILVNYSNTRLWPLFLSVIYIISISLRILIRQDLLAQDSEFIFLYIAGPSFIYLVHSMNHRTLQQVREALDYSRSANEEIAEINSRLWSRSTELSEALEAAHLASEAKSRFLANMSHELRTPLNAILGYAAIVKEELQDLPNSNEELPPSLLQDLDHVETAGKHLLGLISDILDLARIEAGQSLLDTEDIDLKALCDDFQQIMKPAANKNNNTFVTNLTDPTLSIHTDVTKLRQILFNLIGNATKFTTDGIISLNISQKENFIVFEVEDTGKGIPQNKLDTLFEPFEQVDSSSTRIHGGAGLGLALCKQLVELLGGVIHVESTLNKGSTFSFVLPQTQTHLNDQENAYAS